MNDIYAAAIGGGLTGTIGVIVGYIRLKRLLKAEIVDPEISRIEGVVYNLRRDFDQKLARVQEDYSNLSSKIDKKFDELNHKMDKNSQAVSTMQGMVTAIFNGCRNSQYGQ